MKNYFSAKTLAALAVAFTVAAGYETPLAAQPVSPPANAGTLPAGIQPGTPVAEVIKLAQAGVDASVIQNYINNCPGAFNVNADEIISLTDAGVSSDMVNAMIAHDKNFSAAMTQPAAPSPVPSEAPSPTPANNSEVTPPPTPVTQTDFDSSLSPYGQWIQVDGYGRCWRPTTVVYDSTWQPYCDRGRWVYTDCGWYWDSDYSWGITFHYGRWFHHDRYGWCWWPDTVWAPSWVTWRSSGNYCGWAPLPPFAVYQPGIGFTYRGAGVAVGFDFGLSAGCFTFVSVGNFCQPHPRNYCVPRQQVTQIYNQTTIINNYNSHNRTIVNNGISVTTIGAAARRPIQPVSVNTLANSRNHGWPAGNSNWNAVRSDTGAAARPNTVGAGNSEYNRIPTQRNVDGNNYNHQNNHQNSAGNNGHRPPFSQPAQPVNRSGETLPASHPQNYGTPSSQQSQPSQHQPGWSGHNDYYPPAQNPTPHAANIASAPSSPAQNQPANTGGRNPNWPTQSH